MKNIKKIVSIFLLSFLFFSLSTSLITTGVADEGLEDESDLSEIIDTDPDEIDENTQKNTERVVDVDVNAKSASIDSKLKNTNRKDDFSIDVNALSSLYIKGLYKSHEEQDNVNLEFQVTFYSLIEFEDLDGNGIYDEDSETVVQNYQINSFKDIDYVFSDAHIITINTSDDIFVARIFAVEGFTDINGTIISPAEIKIDFEIHNFPFISEESLLALQVRFQSNAQYRWRETTHAEEEGYAKNDTAIDIEDDGETGYFAWANNAYADGNEIEVKSSSLTDNGNSKKFYLCYQQADEIIHDPTFGIAMDYNIISTTELVIIGIVALGLVGLITGLIVKKRR